VQVVRIYPDQEMLTIAWYGQGVRVLDISGLADVEGSAENVAIGRGVGMREIGHYVFPDADTWSFKTNRITRSGSFFGYGNDLTRGFDVTGSPATCRCHRCGRPTCAAPATPGQTRSR
jgi:hypothetical protein